MYNPLNKLLIKMGCSGTKEISSESKALSGATRTTAGEIVAKPIIVEKKKEVIVEPSSPVSYKNNEPKEQEIVNFDLDNVLNDIGANLKEEQVVKEEPKPVEQKVEEKVEKVETPRKDPVAEIIFRICSVLNETDIKNVNILKCNTFTSRKEYFDRFENEEDIKISLLKCEPLEWSRKPYSEAMSQIEDIFKAPEYMKYNGIKFEPQQLEYENLFVNLNLKAGSTFENVQVKTGEEFVLFFFNYNDFDSYTKVHELISLGVQVYFIYNEFISSKKDAMGTMEICQNVLGIDKEIYFIDKKERNIKYFDITSPLCVCVDSEGIIRYLGNPRDLYVNDIFHYSKGNKSAYTDFTLKLKDYVLKCNNEVPLSTKVQTKRIEVYNTNGEKLRELSETPHVMFESLDHNQTVQSKEGFLHKLPSQTYSVNNIQTPVFNAEIILNELEKIKILHDGLSDMKYSIIVKNKRTYHKQLRYYKTSEREICITFHIAAENHGEYMAIAEELSYMKAFPNLPKIYSISLIPDIDTQISNQIHLAEDTIYLSEEKPKFVILFGYSPIAEERLVLVRRLQTIWDTLKNYTDTIDIILLFKGDSFNDANELLQEEIFNSYIEVRVIQDTSPLLIHYESNNDFYCMILDSENYVKYIGTTVDLNLESTLEGLAVGRNEVFYLDEAGSDEELKKDMNIFVTHLKSLEEEYVYNPIVELKTAKALEFGTNGVTSKSYQPPSLKIITKKTNDEEGRLMKDKKALALFKKFKSQYEGNVVIDFVNSIGISSPGSCIKCGKKGRYYDQNQDCFYCELCEKITNRQDNPLESNLILIHLGNKSNIINEVVEELYCQNVRSEGYNIENNNEPCCAICTGNLTGTVMAWMSLIHIGDPVIFCNVCTKPLIEGDGGSYSDEQRRRIKLLGLTQENGFVLRKMILQSSNNI
jgi:hypothetical protein